MKVLQVICVIFVAFLISLLCVYTFTEPSNLRDWNDDQDTLPYADIEADSVTVHNIRNFTYTSTTSYTKAYYDKTYDLSRLKKVWYIVEPFEGVPGSAHTFLSFEFEGDEFLAISVEIRKEKGESFNPLLGLLNRYELMYVVADERDVIQLRSNFRNDPTYVYPVRTSEAKARALFLDMMNRVNALYATPEFYNTLTNTCTTNIAGHVNEVTPRKVPFFSLRILFPAHSDKLAYDLGLLDTDLTLEKARSRYLINDRAKKYADSPDFSRRIRESE